MSHAAPVAQTDRIDSLDVLRGFALLGILMMNIQSFSMPMAAYVNPTAYGDLQGANYWVWLLSHLFFDQKFMTIFSMLFGAGVVLFTTRAAERGAPAGALHYRRTLWLLSIGAVHAYLVWYGDILVTYALCALVVYLFRNRSPKALLATGVVSIAIGSGTMLAAGLSMPTWPEAQVEEMASMWQPSSGEIADEIAAYQGSWRGQLAHRVPAAWEFHSIAFALFAFWRVAGLMLVGMSLYKWGVLSAASPPRLYATMVLAGVLGPLVSYLGVRQNQAANWAFDYGFFFGGQFNYWGSLLSTTAYVGLLMLFCRSQSGMWIKQRLRAVGQMAFTNYLAQTLISVTIFYGHGLGMFGQVPRTGQVLIVVAIWAVQLVFSPVWLQHFRFGPFEWLWRSLTYWELQPMRRAQRVASYAT